MTFLERLLDIFRRGNLRPVPFLMRIRGQLFLNPLHTAHPRKMPAAIFDDFVTAVAQFFRAGKIPKPQHPRAEAARRKLRLAVHEMAVKFLLKFPDERMIFPQLPPQTSLVKNCFERSGIKERMTEARKNILVERNFAAHFFHRARAGNFIQIGHEHEIVGTTIRQAARDGVALEIFRHPRVG